MYPGKRTCCWMKLAEAVIDGTRKEFMESVATVPLLIVDDFGMRKLPATAAEDLLEIVMRRYMSAPARCLTSNRPVEDWGSTGRRSGRDSDASIVYSIMGTCSNAVRAVGAPKAAVTAAGATP